MSAHERRLRELPCLVSRRKPVTLHHCHGGSMLDLGWVVGMGQRQNPFLQIPLHAEYHVGAQGIDAGMGVMAWERLFGTQRAHLSALAGDLGYEVWPLARAWEAAHRAKTLEVQRDPGSGRRYPLREQGRSPPVYRTPYAPASRKDQ